MTYFKQWASKPITLTMAYILIAWVSAASGQTAQTGRAGRISPPYNIVIGDDWSRFTTKAELRNSGYFWWFRKEDVYDHVDIVRDPTYGQVARITFKASKETGFAPKINATLPVPLEKFWFRWRMKYSPGWTSVGPLPEGYANSYKIAFWLWDDYEGRGEIQLSNTDEYILGVGVAGVDGYLRYAETSLIDSQPKFGRITTEWAGTAWWEFVVYYEKTGATTARQRWWRRRLASGPNGFPGPWTYVGVQLSGSPTPRVRGITLGANRNKNNPVTMYIYWGPWEVVDGTRHPNPFRMPNL
jgi:hypothetical protein